MFDELNMGNVRFLDREGRVSIVCTTAFAASPEGKVLVKALQEINDLRLGKPGREHA